ncbi:MAG: hypothetical protein ACR2LN_04040 [Candidatus Levyibacteriota bacterium]
MDQLSEEKKKLEEAIVDIMIRALEQEEISEFKMSQMSAFVLDGIDAAKTQQEVKVFLQTLAERWELFKPLVFLEEAKMQEKIDDEVAQGVLILLEHGKIENAIKLAKSVTHKQEQNQIN